MDFENPWFKSAEDVDKLLVRNLTNPVETALLALGISTGLRPGDILALERWQLQALADGFAIELVQRKTLTITVLSPTPFLRHYIEPLVASFGSKDLSAFGAKMSAQRFSNMVGKAAFKAGVAGSYNAPSLRKTYYKGNLPQDWLARAQEPWLTQSGGCRESRFEWWG